MPGCLSFRRTPCGRRGAVEPASPPAKVATHAIFIVDCSGSMEHIYAPVVIPGCKALGNYIACDTQTVVLFGVNTHVTALPSTKPERDAAWDRIARKDLEAATNILGGLRAAVDHAALLRLTANKSAAGSRFLFMFLSDGGDNCAKGEADIEQKMHAMKSIVHAQRMDASFFVLAIGGSADTRLAMRAKTAIETMTHPGPAIYQANADPASVERVMYDISSDMAKTRVREELTITVAPAPQRPRRTPRHPSSASTAHSSSSSSSSRDEKEPAKVPPLAPAATLGVSSTLFPPWQQRLAVPLDGERLPSFWVTTADPTGLELRINEQPAAVQVEHDRASSEAVAPLLLDAIEAARIAVVAKSADANDHIRRLQRIVDRYRRPTADPTSTSDSKTETKTDSKSESKSDSKDEDSKSDCKSERFDRSAAGRLALMRSRGEWLAVETELNKLVDQVNLTRSMDSSQLASWLTSAQSMRHGAQALRLARSPQLQEVVQDLKDVLIPKIKELKEALEKTEEAELKREGGRGLSILSTMSASQHLTDPTLVKLMSDEKTVASLTLPQLLYMYGTTGVGIRVRRSEASNINPWAIGVDYVSSDYFDTPSVMCAIDSKLEHTLIDLHREPVSDVLVLQDPELPLPGQLWMASKLHPIYTSVVVTRNLELFMGAQPIALNAAALLRAIDQLRQEKYRSVRHVETIFHIICNLHRQVRHPAMKDYWAGIVEAMITSAEPGERMTEAEGDDIASVTKLVVALVTQDSATKLVQSAAWPRVKRAVLAETISRLARQHARFWWHTVNAKPATEPVDVYALMSHVLGIPDDTKTIPTASVADVPARLSQEADALDIIARDEKEAKKPEDERRGGVDEKTLGQCLEESRAAGPRMAQVAKDVCALEAKTAVPGPRGMGACLAFVQRLHSLLAEKKMSVEDLVKAHSSASNARELTETLYLPLQQAFAEPGPAELSEDLLVALSLQGLRYHQSSARRSQTGWCDQDAAAVVRSLVKDLADHIWQKRIGVVKAEIAAEEERQRIMAKATERKRHLDWREERMFRTNEDGSISANWYLFWPLWARGK